MERYTWFKFSPAQWFMGRIQRCSPEAQADYMRLVCLYWNKGGEMTEEDAQDECIHFEELLQNRVLKISEGMILISFLDEQLEDIEEMSEKRSRAGKASAAKRSKRSTSVQQVLTHDEQVSTDKRREDKIREEKNREEKNREEEKNKRFTKREFVSVLIDLGCDDEHVDDWVQVRKEKKLSYTKTSLKRFIDECNAHNFPIPEAVKICAQNSWGGFKYEWLKKQNNQSNGDTEISADWLASS